MWTGWESQGGVSSCEQSLQSRQPPRGAPRSVVVLDKDTKPLTPIWNQTREQGGFQAGSSTTDLPCVINEVLRKMNAHKLTPSKMSTTLKKAIDERKLLSIKSSLEPRQRQKLHSALCKWVLLSVFTTLTKLMKMVEQADLVAHETP